MPYDTGAERDKGGINRRGPLRELPARGVVFRPSVGTEYSDNGP